MSDNESDTEQEGQEHQQNADYQYQLLCNCMAELTN